MARPEADMTDENDGHWQKYPRDLFIQILKNKDGEATTTEITDEAGCSNETTRRKMSELEDRGVVEKREIGTVFVWRFADS
jgi:DeoR/GlpR family transcriptional regulator of sugar metabolism